MGEDRPRRRGAPGGWAPGGRRPPAWARSRRADRLTEAALSWLRWAIIATMLLITLAWPVPGRAGYQIWPLVAAFAAYNGAVELARWRVPRLRSFAWVPFLDLPVAGLLYWSDAEPGGPLFVAFFLAVVTMAVTHRPRPTLAYTAAAVVLIVAIAPTLPQWSPGPAQLRQLAARMTVLVLVAAGTGLMTQRLAHQEAAARAMREEALRLGELDRLRADFVASVSHDLRTPLTAVRAGLGLLADSAADRLRPDERELFANARRNAERLGALIDDLLAHNELEAGVLTLERAPLDLRGVVADAIATVHPLMRQKGQRLEVDLPEPLPALGDARRLAQAVTNVLGNAHRHTPAGTCVSVRGRVVGDEVRLAVGDDGPGIPSAELDGIFDRFRRLDPAAGGSGLGLANARRLVELHGGRIWAEGGSGRGATFRIALPRAAEGDER